MLKGDISTSEYKTDVNGNFCSLPQIEIREEVHPSSVENEMEKATGEIPQNVFIF